MYKGGMITEMIQIQLQQDWSQTEFSSKISITIKL